MPDPPLDDGSGPNVGISPGNNPGPDPTVLTTQALYREITAVTSIIGQRIDALLALQDEKQLATDQKIDLQVTARKEALQAIKEDWRHEHENLIKEIDKTFSATTHIRAAEVQLVSNQVEHLSETVEERFRSIATQFLERDTRSERESRDNKVAVDAAFAAQKEAAAKQEETFSKGIDKSEAATQETINKLTELFRTTNQGLSDKVDDLKQRLVDSERNTQQRITEVASTASQFSQQKQGAADSRAVIAWAITGLLTIMLIVGTIIAFKG